MLRHRSVVSRLTVGLLIAAGCLLSAPASAQNLAQQVPSLKWIPANAGTYSAMLRNREQIDIVLNSKAVAKLMSLPFVQKNKQVLQSAWDNAKFQAGSWAGAVAEFKKWYSQPGNPELVAMLGDLTSDEIFMYADKNCAEFFALYQDVYSTVQLAPFTRILKGGPEQAFNDPKFQARVALQTLSENVKKLKFPDFVIGFKLSKTKPAELTKTIEGAIKLADSLAPPQLKGRWKKTTIHGSEVNTFTVDGSLVPWDMIPFKDFEEVPGQFDMLRKKLRELQVTFAVSVRDNYLLLSFGEGIAGLQALGAPGKLLIDVAEFAPLTKLGDRRLTSIAYVSKEFRSIGSEIISTNVTGGGFKLDDAMKFLDSMLRESTLTPPQQAKIRKDFRTLLYDIKRYSPIVGAHLEFGFLNNRGLESYAYDWSKNHGVDSTKPLTILDHVGGQPIAFNASRSPAQLDSYADVVKYMKLVHEYVEEFGVPRMPPMEKEMYHKVMNLAMPYFTRLDKTTGKMLLPSVDGQGAWVLDGRLKIKLPEVPRPMPVPEVGMCLGLSNAKLFGQAMTEYRGIFNDAVDTLTKFAPPGEQVPDFKIPLPRTTNVPAGTLYSWALPKLPELDPLLQPTAGMSDKVAVFAVSEDHAIRLLTKTPFKMEGGPLGNPKKHLAEASYFNWAGMIDTLFVPWTEFVMTEGIKPGVDREIADQVRVVLEVLKVLRTYTSVTYLEQGAVVTHGEAVFRDLEK